MQRNHFEPEWPNAIAGAAVLFAVIAAVFAIAGL